MVKAYFTACEQAFPAQRAQLRRLALALGRGGVERMEQLCAAGRPAEYGDVLREVNERDERDMNRAVSPLRRAEDAYLIDSSDMTIDEVVDAILNRVAQARARS